MVYFFKFCAGFVLPPGIFILALAAFSVYLWRRAGQAGGVYAARRRTVSKGAAGLLMIVTLVLYLFCTTWMSEKAMHWLESEVPPAKDPTGDVVVMLGGGAFPDTPDVSGKGTLCSAPANRLLTAVRLQRKLDVPILLSGGQVYEDSGAEAQIAKRILMDLGVPEEKILVESKSINTTQNARYSAELLKEKGLTKPVLVTSAFHMKRAMLNFENQGVKPVPFPSDYRTPGKQVFHYVKLAPSAEALYDNVTVLREVVRAFVTRYFE